jgi:hypothetical protein
MQKKVRDRLKLKKKHLPDLKSPQSSSVTDLLGRLKMAINLLEIQKEEYCCMLFNFGMI